VVDDVVRPRAELCAYPLDDLERLDRREIELRCTRSTQRVRLRCLHVPPGSTKADGSNQH